jgi:hypothetical protein
MKDAPLDEVDGSDAVITLLLRQPLLFVSEFGLGAQHVGANGKPLPMQRLRRAD